VCWFFGFFFRASSWIMHAYFDVGVNMKAAQLGRNGPEVPALGFGCMGLSDFYTTNRPDESTGIDIIRRALDAGIRLLDTADMYGPWTNEQLVGKAIAGRRKDAFIATKFGIMRNERGERLGINGRPDYVRSSCDASLKRLGIEQIDLYFQHRVDPNVPIEDTVGAMADLVRAGKVRYLGLSEASTDTIRRAHAIHPITAVESEFSLWTRDPETSVLPLCRKLGIGFVAYSPLGRGFLTGRFTANEFDATDFRRHSPRFQQENLQRNLGLVERLKQIAAEKKCTTAQLALAWVLAQGRDIVPIPGTTNAERLQENVAALEVELDAATMQRIDAQIPLGAAAGPRYDEAGMRTVNR
jgi:aryl-alcohol dehydrogenase-like predicted oxidoreductase